MSIPTHLVFYDGNCGFCDFTVQWLLKRDSEECLYFAPLQGTLAAELLPRYDLPEDLDSLIYLRTHDALQEVFVHSDAVVEIVMSLPVPWRWIQCVKWIPKGFRDWGYKQFAKRRLKIFGTVDACTIPTESQAKRLLY